MALSELKTLTQRDFGSLTITPFDLTPESSSTGDPTANATISLAGWVGTDKIAFSVSNGENILTSVSLDTGNDLVAITANGFSPAQSQTAYFTVNLGSNAIASDWSLTFSLSSTSKTGKWTFVKGKMTNDDDIIPKL
jgi:hypothetical protein